MLGSGGEYDSSSLLYHKAMVISPCNRGLTLIDISLKAQRYPEFTKLTYVWYWAAARFTIIKHQKNARKKKSGFYVMWSVKNKKRKFTLYPCKKSIFHAKKSFFLHT